MEDVQITHIHWKKKCSQVTTKILYVFSFSNKKVSVILNANDANNEKAEVLSPTEVTGISIPANCNVIPCKISPLQIPQKTIRSNSDFHKHPNTYESFTSQDKSSGATPYQFHYQNTETFSI